MIGRIDVIMSRTGSLNSGVDLGVRICREGPESFVIRCQSISVSVDHGMVGIEFLGRQVGAYEVSEL